uniref:Uncharacterized protein n=1 Tax=Chelydra serpentina TaxID=8475 RepID=A0A8C3RXQ0_CHESE
RAQGRFKGKRAVAEHQFMQDKGRALQGLKRLMWLHNAMGSVHTARARDVSHSNSLWDSPKSQDLPDLYDSTSKDETPNLVKQLLLELTEKEQAFPVLKKTDLRQYLKNPKGRQEKPWRRYWLEWGILEHQFSTS